MPEIRTETATEAWGLDWERRLYRRMAPVYDAYRWALGRWTHSAEEELDRLFAARVGPGTRILELAPGTGINIERLLRCAPDFASYLGIDISPDMLERARHRAGGDPRFELRTADATALAAVEGPFDFVVCTWMLSHRDDPAAAVAQALEKLAPGGSGVFVFFSEPDRAAVRWAVRSAAHALRTPFVDPEPIRRIPDLERMTRHGGGMATLAVFRRPG